MRIGVTERDGSNNPLVSYTRGNDLSGSMEGAGGIGGLLARSDGYSGGNFTAHNYYFADGNGNITYMLGTNQSMVASYRYDPFGYTISSAGTLANANLYRFSSKELNANSGLYYYGYRFYDPNMQRWVNRDPIAESGGQNLYAFNENEPIGHLDSLGLMKASEVRQIQRQLDAQVSKTECCCTHPPHFGYHVQGSSLGNIVMAKAIINTPQAERDCIYRVYYFWWTCYDAVKEGPDNSPRQGWSAGGASFWESHQPSPINENTGINWPFDPFHLALESEAIVLECLAGHIRAVLVGADEELLWSWSGDPWDGGHGWNNLISY